MVKRHKGKLKHAPPSAEVDVQTPRSRFIPANVLSGGLR
jgi:hypothetical protein